MHSPQTALLPVVPSYPAQPHQPTASVDPATKVPPSQPPRCSTGTLRIRTARIYAISKCSRTDRGGDSQHRRHANERYRHRDRIRPRRTMSGDPRDRDKRAAAAQGTGEIATNIEGISRAE